MGATAWSGKFPQYMGSVKEASAINKIKIDDDNTVNGKILIQGSSAAMGTSTSAKSIHILVDGNGTEDFASSRGLKIENKSKLGELSL